MNILLTGSGGFIGKNLKEYFKNEQDVLAPRSFELDLNDKSALEKYFKENNIGFIIHAASQGARINPEATMQDVCKPNLDMFENLAHFARGSVKMITLGSGAEYDKSRPLVKVKEADFGISVPQDPYGYSKYLISKSVEKHDNILNLRLFGVYGSGEDKTRAITSMINDNIAKRPIKLNKNVVFDFLFIDDLCKIIEKFIEKMPEEKFINVTPSKSIEILELANIVNELSEYKSDIVFKESGFNKEYSGDNSRLLSILGDNFAFTSYKNGVKKLYEDIKNGK